MTLELYKPDGKSLDSRLLNQRVTAVSRRAAIEHVRAVLKFFAAKSEFSRFYIGITNDLERRLGEHRGHPELSLYRWMCPVLEEEVPHVDEGSFDALEQAAIRELRGGIRNPQSGAMLLSCSNKARGALPKNILYILVGGPPKAPTA